MSLAFAGTQRLARATSGVSGTTFSLGISVLWTAFPAAAGYSNVVSRGANAICAFNQAGTVKLDIGTAADTTGSTLVLNRWYRLIYSRNASNIHKAYVNGVLDITTAADAAAGTELDVGSFSSGGALDFTGWVEGLWVIDGYEVTAAEARFIDESQRPDLVRGAPNLLAYPLTDAGMAVREIGGRAAHFTATTGTLKTAEPAPRPLMVGRVPRRPLAYQPAGGGGATYFGWAPSGVLNGVPMGGALV